MICISIPESDVDACLALVEGADMAEIRIDLAGFGEDDVKRVFSSATKPLIATCRPEIVSDEKRVKLLQIAIESGAAYVDIEIEASDDITQLLISFAKQYQTKVIISYHNYEITPPEKELQAIVNTCYERGADIAKIATTACNAADSACVLGLYKTYSSLVALAMGEYGKITRIANVYLGSPFTFAAIHKNHVTAPGQLTLEQMRAIEAQIAL